MPTATVRTIAAHTGLSYQTVSFILNGRGSFRAETRQRVEAAVRELGYRPHAAARAMRDRRHGAIGLLAHHDNGLGYIAPTFLEGLLAGAEAMRCRLALAGVHQDQLISGCQDLPALLREQAVDGLVVNGAYRVPDEARERLAAQGTPVVWCNFPYSENAVTPDDRGAAAAAVAALVARGHRRIAYASFTHDRGLILADDQRHHYSIQARWQGYVEAMRAAGLTPRLAAHEAPLQHGEHRPVPVDWLQVADAPTAVLFYDHNGVATADAILRSRGAGRSDIAAFANLPLAVDGRRYETWVVPQRAMAEAAVAMLSGLIADPSATRSLVTIPLQHIEAT